ncbi:MAG: flagellar motor protein MotB [Thermoguttaceae bacterium]|jgi:chemotaxis protein MotB
MAGHGGGAWKVAYADFVTAMMAFFLVMWIVAQSKPVKQAIAQYFKDPWKTSAKAKGDMSAGGPLATSKKPNEVAASLSPSVKSGYIPGGQRSHSKPTLHGRGVALAETNAAQKKKHETAPADSPSLFLIHKGDRQYIGTMVLFGEGSSELDEGNKERLTRLSREFRGLPHKIEIRGHATRRPVTPGGEAADAWGLSYARCLATMRFLEQQGVEQARIRLSQGGPYEPYSMDTAPAKFAFNSRVEVYMLAEYAEDLMGTPEERASRFTGP